MTTLNKYYFCTSFEGEGAPVLIIATDTLNCAVIRYFKNYSAMYQEVSETRALASATVLGYNIALYFYCNLAGAKQDDTEKLRNELKQMAAFFLEHKIKPKPKFYDREYSIERNP